jgi:iron complex transport system substrate-binding protein
MIRGNFGRRIFSVVITVWTAAAVSAAAAATPERIVSINLCSDQLLLMLVEPRRIASVTYLAAKPTVSPLSSIAQGIPQNYGRAEEILMLRPDLVLASVFTTHSTNALLRKLGIPVLEIPVADSIDDIRANILKVATALGNPDNGKQLLENFEHRLSAASLSPTPPRAVAALYRENNILYGSNTIAGTFTHAAGYENLADKLGIGNFSDVPLEILIESQPDLVITGTGVLRAAPGIRAYRGLRHPALSNLLEKRWLVRIPDRLWACGSPAIVEAIRMLSALHLKWRSQKKPERDVDASS